jgi:hypothetical protein
MNAVLAIIADDGRAICCNYFIDSDKTLLRPTPCEEALGGGVGVCSSIKTMALEGKRLHRGGDVCVLVFS